MSIIPSIRYADYEDIETVMAIQQSIWLDDDNRNDLETFEEAVDEELLYVCELHNKIIGFALCYINNDTNDIHIGDICVIPEHRGKGYGTQIIQFILNDCDNCITLEVETENTKAFELYKKLGFELKYTKHYMRLERNNGD